MGDRLNRPARQRMSLTTKPGDLIGRGSLNGLFDLRRHWDFQLQKSTVCIVMIR